MNLLDEDVDKTLHIKVSLEEDTAGENFFNMVLNRKGRPQDLQI
jgi:hypothetical protein